MSLKSKLVFASLGVAIGSLAPLVSAYSATVNPSNSQYTPQATTAKATEQSDQIADTTPSTDQSKTKKVTKSKDAPFKDQPKEFTWDGSYIGVFAGGAWGNSRLNSNAGVVSPTSYFAAPSSIRSVNANSTGTVQPKTPVGGIQVGTNIQSGRLVYGGVLDYGSLNLSATKNAAHINYPGFAATYNLKASMSTTWLASLRARVGFTPSVKWPLFYATGGIAITNLHVYNSFKDSIVGVGGATKTKIKAGWVVGAGVEYPFNDKWSIDGEYQFVNFGSIAANGTITCAHGACPGIHSPFSTSANLSANMARVGLNYRLS